MRIEPQLRIINPAYASPFRTIDSWPQERALLNCAQRYEVRLFYDQTWVRLHVAVPVQLLAPHRRSILRVRRQFSSLALVSSYPLFERARDRVSDPYMWQGFSVQPLSVDRARRAVLDEIAIIRPLFDERGEAFPFPFEAGRWIYRLLPSRGPVRCPVVRELDGPVLSVSRPRARPSRRSAERWHSSVYRILSRTLRSRTILIRNLSGYLHELPAAHQWGDVPV